MDRLRAKSLKLTGYLETLIRAELADDVTIFTPSDPAQRGCQLSICFTKCNDLEAVNKQLKAKGVIVDTRKPNVMRVAPAPLYNSFEDVWRFVHLLKETLRGLDVKKQ